MQDLIEALTILKKYLIKQADAYLYKYPTKCKNGKLLVCVKYININKQDLERLEDLGFEPDEFTGYMVSYRFGTN